MSYFLTAQKAQYGTAAEHEDNLKAKSKKALAEYERVADPADSDFGSDVDSDESSQ